MLHFYLLMTFAGVIFSQELREHSAAERMRLLGPFAPSERRLVFDCPAMTASPRVPTSVHQLRPADIKHVAAMGDSLTAANGAKANTGAGVLVEYRGVSWSIGGDEDLNTVITLPNILRRLNPYLDGPSYGTGNRNSTRAGFNVARAGAVSVEMASQANLLVERMRRDLGSGAFTNDWKLVTFFIGGNDLCSYCKDTQRFTAAVYVENIKNALDILKARMPRTLVNLVVVLNVGELEDLHDGISCQTAQNLMCVCGVNKKTRDQIRAVNIEYQKATNDLINSGIYDTSDDFTVVLQPFMENMKVPKNTKGDTDFSYFSPDCFHFSKKGHEAAAIELWNNMMQKVGEKTKLWNLEDKLSCSDQGNGYIYTSKNSN